MKQFILKSLLYIIAACLLLCVIFLGVSQTKFFKNKIKSLVTDQLNNLTGLDCSIEKLDGNLFHTINFSNIQFNDETDTLLTVPQLSIKWRPVSLLHKKIYIENISIRSPKINYQKQNVIKNPPQQDEKQPEKKPTDFPFTIDVHSLNILNAYLSMLLHQQQHPFQISDLDLSMSALYSNQLKKINLLNLSLKTQNPDFSIKQCLFSLEESNDIIKLSDFSIQTAQNQISINAGFSEKDSLQISAELDTRPVSMEEFQFVLPDIYIKNHPKIHLNTKTKNDSVYLSIQLTDEDQKLFITGKIFPFAQILNKEWPSLFYNIQVNFENMLLHQWFLDSHQKTKLNGHLTIDGSGLDLKNLNTQYNANFTDCFYNHYKIDSLNMNGLIVGNKLENNLKFYSPFAKLYTQLNVKKLLSENVFQFYGSLENGNTAIPLNKDSLLSDLNINISAFGNFPKFKNPDINILCNGSGSQFHQIKIDTLSGSAHLQSTDISLDSLFIVTNIADLNANGDYTENSLNFNYDILFKDLTSLPAITDSLSASGQITGKITGPPDSLYNDLSMLITDIHSNFGKADSLKGNLKMLKTTNDFAGSAELDCIKFSSGTFNIDKLGLKSLVEDGNINSKLAVQISDSLSLSTEIDTKMDGLLTFHIPSFEITFFQNQWSGGSDSTYITISDTNYTIRHFNLSKIKNNVSGKLAIDGFFSTKGDENLNINLSNVYFENSVFIPQGFIDAEIKVQGTAIAPEIKGKIQARDIKYKNYIKMNFINTDFNFYDNSLSCLLNMATSKKDTLQFKGTVPVLFSFTNPGPVFVKDKPLDLKLKTSPISLENLYKNQNIGQLEGSLISDLQVKNTLEKPILDGYVNLTKGHVQLPKWGIDYKDINLLLSAEQDKIQIKEFNAFRDKGIIKASGYVKYNPNAVTGFIQSSDLDLSLKDFYLVKNNNYELQVTGQSTFNGTPDSLLFNGGMTVQRSSFYLPALDQSQTPMPQNRPLLVQAQKAFKTDSVFKRERIAELQKPQKSDSPNIWENMSGKYKVKIPRNTWIKSPDMRFEISGDLDLVKNRKKTELFGQLKIVRGFYELYGRRFSVIDGTITFQGGDFSNPNVEINTSYVFRDGMKEKHTLYITVQGAAKSPALSFKLDEQTITEGDALSYIMFGQSIHQISTGQKKTLASSTGTGGIAGGIFTNLLSAQLSKTLGKKFNLDFIEIKGQDSWQNAAFYVGKYLTNDLFLSYQKGFGENVDDDFVPENVTLEYQVNKFLFLQLLEGSSKDSGFDIIFKYEW